MPSDSSRNSSLLFTDKAFSNRASTSPSSPLGAPPVEDSLRIPSPATQPIYKDLLSGGTALHLARDSDDPFLYRPPSLPLTPTAYSFPPNTPTPSSYSFLPTIPTPATEPDRQSTPSQATSDAPAFLAAENSVVSSEILQLYESLPPLSRVTNRVSLGEI